MAFKGHLQELGKDRDALFINDPTAGDVVVVGTWDELYHFKIPSTAEGYEFTTVHTLLRELDFDAYGEDGFNLILLSLTQSSIWQLSS